MLIGTHAGLPLLPLAWRHMRAGKNGGTTIPWWCLITTAIFGALPDILNPHLSLESRLTSWSHGLPCFALITLLLFLAAIPRQSPVTAKWAAYWSLAYGAHLFCDAISGGIAWAYPLANHVWGDQRIPPGLWWFASDFFFIIANYTLLRLIPLWRLRSNKNG